MKTPPLAGQPVRVVIRRLGISSASGLEARRLADSLTPALERAFAALRDSASTTRIPRRHTPADRVAHEIADAVADRLRGIR